jgi:hypothetical protein
MRKFCLKGLLFPRKQQIPPETVDPCRIHGLVEAHGNIGCAAVVQCPANRFAVHYGFYLSG